MNMRKALGQTDFAPHNAITPPKVPHGAYFTNINNMINDGTLNKVYKPQPPLNLEWEDPAYTAH